MISLKSIFESLRHPIPKFGQSRVNNLTNNIMMKWAKEKEPALFSIYNFYLNQIKLRFQTQAQNTARIMMNNGQYMRDLKKHNKSYRGNK